MTKRSIGWLALANAVLFGILQAATPSRLDASGWPFDKPCCEISAEETCVCVYVCFTGTCANSAQCVIERMCPET